ncbi:MAG: hypothetical protein KY468_14340 [Armatimonadetes bacterium]|nr:hypothetical protein [Armatimonadota bacterium]
MDSTDSRIYPGIAKGQTGTVPYQRKVAAYVPQQYVAGKPAPFIVVQDGVSYRNLLPVVLDCMIHQRRLPVMIAVMINSGGDSKGSQRGLEYDTLSDTYATFIEDEVPPRIAREYQITFTKDPNGRVSMGESSGGAAAFTMAWYRPDLYRRVLTDLLRHLRGSAVAGESGNAAWRVGVPRASDPAKPPEAFAGVAGGQRERQRLEEGRSLAPQLSHGEPAHDRRTESEGLSLPVRVRPGDRAHGRAGDAPNAAERSGVALAGLPNPMIP